METIELHLGGGRQMKEATDRQPSCRCAGDCDWSSVFLLVIHFVVQRYDNYIIIFLKL